MPIAGYHMYYLKRGEPIMDENDDLKSIPVTLKSILVPVGLEDSAKELIKENGNTVLNEDVIRCWCDENGLVLGQD